MRHAARHHHVLPVLYVALPCRTVPCRATQALCVPERQVVGWFEVARGSRAAFSPRSFPVFIIQDAEASYYGFPLCGQQDGEAAAQHGAQHGISKAAPPMCAQGTRRRTASMTSLHAGDYQGAPASSKGPTRCLLLRCFCPAYGGDGPFVTILRLSAWSHLL